MMKWLVGNQAQAKSKNADVMKIQLEVLEQQNEMIKEEQEERDAYAAAKEKEEKDQLHEKESMRESEISTVEEESQMSKSEKPLLATQAVPEKSKQSTYQPAPSTIASWLNNLLFFYCTIL